MNPRRSEFCNNPVWLRSMHRVPVLPFVNGLLGRAEPFRQHRGGSTLAWIAARTFGCRRRLLVKMDQHVRTPPRISPRTDLAMKNAERRGSMRSSGVEHTGIRNRLNFSPAACPTVWIRNVHPTRAEFCSIVRPTSQTNEAHMLSTAFGRHASSLFDGIFRMEERMKIEYTLKL